MNWYKLVRNGKITVWQAAATPIIWGAMDYRLYVYMPELGCNSRRNWVQIDGML